MAGGTFDKNVGKVRPGTYMNFKAQSKAETAKNGTRGTVIVPIINSDYGPAGKWILIQNTAPDANMALLGHSIYDTDENRQMLLIREALKNATKVYAYILAEGTKASGEASLDEASLTATAKYGGTRGNALTVTISADAVEGYDVIISLDGTRMEKFEALSTIEDLIEAGSNYIDFTGSGDLAEVAGLNLTGGTDAEATNDDITTWMDAWEGLKFNTACLPVDDTSVKAAAAAKVLYMRETMGKCVQVVMPDYAADYEGVINVTNSVEIDDDELTHAEACAWVAGATAGADYLTSLTYKEYDGATGIVDPKTHEQAELAIKNGELFFSVSEAGAVVVEYDINSLISFDDTSGKDESYRKNRVIRVFDTFEETVQEYFPPNKYNNNPTDWEIMQGMGKSILKIFEDDGAIQDVDYDNDFVIDQELSTGDQTFFDVKLMPVDSAEKLYYSVTTRS